MKTILIAISFFFLNLLGYTQESLLNYRETSILIEGIQSNVGQTHLTGELDNIKKTWQKYMKSQLETKMDEETGLLILRKTVINQITDKRGDLMVYLYNEEQKVTLNVAYKLGYDVYLNSKQFPDEGKRMQEFIEAFTYEYYDAFLPDYIKSKEKGLKVLLKEKKKAAKRIKKSQKKIKKGNRFISKQQKKIDKLQNSESELGIDEQIKQKEMQAALTSRKNDLESQVKTIASQQELIDALLPKIEQTKKDISSAKLTLIEVQSKIKTNTGS